MVGGKHVLGKGNSRRVFGTAKVGDRGQIVIPKEARQMFDIKPGDSIVVLCNKSKGIALMKADIIESVADNLL